MSHLVKLSLPNILKRRSLLQSKVGYWSYHGIAFNTSISLSKCISLVGYTQILLLKFLHQFGFKNPIFIKMGSTNCLKWACLTLKIEDLLITKRGVELDTKIRYSRFDFVSNWLYPITYVAHFSHIHSFLESIGFNNKNALNRIQTTCLKRVQAT